VASAGSLSTHIHLKPSLKISGAIPPRNLSPSTAHSGTSFYPNHLPLYISLNSSHPFWSYKGTFLYITFPLHSHYMTHLFHLHWSNEINIMNSSNNKPQSTIFCVVLLLTPSTGQIFSWQLFSLSPSKHVIPSMWQVTFYTNIKWKECLIYWWMKHSTASGTSHAVSTKIKASFLKTAKSPFPRVKFLFHKDTLIQGQAILDIANKKCV